MKKIHIFLLFIIIQLLLVTGALQARELDDANEYFLTGQYQKAIPAYEEALKTASERGEIYYNLGVCNEKVGNLERALYYYEQAGSIKDASTQASRLTEEIKKRKITRLKKEAQTAYEAMNYGVARSKAEEILVLDPQNTWAQGLMETIVTDVPREDTLVQSGESTVAVISKDTTQLTDTLSPGKAKPAGFPWVAGAIVLAVILVAGAFIVGRASNKITVERAILKLIKFLPAGMLSIRTKRNLSLLFFEEGKVIKTLVETENGQTNEGERAVENLLKTKVPYSEKGSGPWDDFANLVIELYRNAEAKSERGNHKSSSRIKQEP